MLSGLAKSETDVFNDGVLTNAVVLNWGHADAVPKYIGDPDPTPHVVIRDPTPYSNRKGGGKGMIYIILFQHTCD